MAYTRDRVAFGRAIGSYQALKHRMATHRIHLEGAFAVTTYAARAVQHERSDAAVAVRAAKAFVGKWGTTISARLRPADRRSGDDLGLRPPPVFPARDQQRAAVRQSGRALPLASGSRRGAGCVTAPESLDAYRERVRAWLSEHVPAAGTA